MDSTRVLLVVGFVVLFVASCGDDKAAAPTPSRPDAMSMTSLPAADASAADTAAPKPDTAPNSDTAAAKADSAPKFDTAPTPAVPSGRPLDIVVVTATQMTPGLNDKAYGVELAKILEGLRTIEGIDLRMALVAPREAMDATFRSALEGKMGAERFRAIDLGLDPKKGLVASVVLGCAATESAFPALTASSTKGPQLCGKDLATLAGVKVGSLEHEWLWELEPLPGKLMDFFRPKARRVYVFVAGGGAGFLTPTQWTDLVAAQPQDGKPLVVSLAPVGMVAMGLCSAGSPDTVFSALAKASGGTALDFCLANWMANTRATADVVKKAVP